MIIPIQSAQGVSEIEVLLDRLATRLEPDNGEARVADSVAAVLDDVKHRGLEAVIEYTRRFDCPCFSENLFQVSSEDLARAGAAIDRKDAEAIGEAAANIRRFHEAQKERSWFQTGEGGALLGQMVLPVDRAGLYVPGGKGGATPLVSSLLMNAIPALVAGVCEIAVISPPRKDGSLNPHLLAAAHLLGITEVYAAGSAWAVAALAYGSGPLRAVDAIAGPGNIYVATAKRLLIGTVGIDMIAGPSEICIVADSTADPAWVAADMLSQAEHDSLASAVLLTPDGDLPRNVVKELERQLETLPRKEIATASLGAYGAIVQVPDLQAAMTISNAVAPEHLELLVADPWSLLPLVRHAGAVFMGHHSAEALGDYFAGPNHVLPTMGTARFSSSLSVGTFCKKTSVIAASPAFAEKNAEAVARLARLEALEGHARSALCRARPGRKDTSSA